MKVLDRYLLREFGLTVLAVLLVLMLVALANAFAQLLALAAGGGLPEHLIPVLLQANAVKFLSFVLPVAFFLGLMLGLGRLYRDSEMAVLRACGVGTVRLWRPVLWLGLPLAVLSAWLSLFAWPSMQALRDNVMDEARSLSELKRVPTGRFIESPDGQVVAYVERLEGDTFRNVFIHTLREGMPGVEWAASGRLATDPDSGRRFVVLEDGRRYEGEAGRGDWNISHYAEHALFLPGLVSAEEKRHVVPDSLTLARSGRPRDQADLHMRLAQPLSVFLLGLLAVPLSRTSPRQGRYARLGIGVLLYVIYFNLLGVGASLIAKGTLPAALGLWWVHALLLALIGGLYAVEAGFWTRRGRTGGPRKTEAAT